MVAKPLCPLYKNIIKPLDRARYPELRLSMGNPNGTRAVAGAIGANGISIFIPCHRVIGSNHLLTGFAGGLDAKRRLLEIEAEQKQHNVDFQIKK